MRADDVAFGADAEELAFDGVEVDAADRAVRRRSASSDFGETFARRLAVDGRVLEAVGNPDVGDAGRAECPAEAAPILRQAMPCSIQNWRMPSSRLASVKPSAAIGMGEEGAVEIEPEAVRFRPVDPAREMLGAELRRARPCGRRSRHRWRAD